MDSILARLQEQIGGYVPSLLAALAVLVFGWLAALAVAALARNAVNRLTKERQVKTESGEAVPIGTWTGRAVFYLLMVLVLAGTFQTLRLEAVAGPLDDMLQRFADYLPQLVGAAALLLVAWVVGTVLRFAVSRALERTKLDERIVKGAGLDAQRPLGKTVGDVVFWLPPLLFLPAILSTLELEGLVAPLQGMFDDALEVLPDLLGAALILLIGWFIARIVRQIASALLAAAGADRLGEKVGMGPDAGERRLSSVVGLLAYALILIPTAIAALDALQIEAISRPATDMLNQILAAVPALFGAALVLGVAFLVGRVVSGLVAAILAGVGFDSLFARLGLKVPEGEAANTPSAIAGYLTLVAIMLIASIEAARLLGFDAVATLVTEFFGFGSRVLLGLVIFGIGLYLGNLAFRAIPRREGRWGGLYGAAARIAIVVLATAMALQQTGVAQEIVTIAFGVILGAIAVAGAIAFGLGSKEAAGRAMEAWLAGSETRPPKG